MSFQTTEHTLGADVAASGSFAVSYPTDTDSGTFEGGVGHKLVTEQNDVYAAPDDFTLTLGAASITVNWGAGNTTLVQGTKLFLQIDARGDDSGDKDVLDGTKRTLMSSVAIINLGAPDVADPDGVAVAQAVAAPGNMTIDGVLAAGGVATFDVPRGVEIDSSGAGDTTQTATVTGTDEYGETIVEDIAFNGTTAVQGKKAFKTVTQVAIDIALAGNGNVGTTDILGLPVFLSDTGIVLKELEDGALATAGVVVVGATAEATATTGDTRGTYDANSAADGAKAFELIAAIADPSYRGVSQFAG